MVKKRPRSILQREHDTGHASQAPSKKQKIKAQPAQQSKATTPKNDPQHEVKKNTAQHAQGRGLNPTSAVHRQAAHAVAKLLAADASQKEGSTLKSLTLAPHIVAKKATYAVTCEVLKYLPVLRQLLEGSQVVERSPGLRQEAALVLVYELLFGERFRGTGPAERAVLGHRATLFQELQRLLASSGADSVAALLPAPSPHTTAAARMPRTARVNTLRMTPGEVLAWLRDPPPGQHMKKEWAGLGVSVRRDPLLPDLLVFPPGTPLHDHPLVLAGDLILQSKASCLPAHALAPQPGWRVIDGCAAPGNKTTHLAALMKNQGVVFAFDRDPRRLRRLQSNAELAGASAIQAQHADFLSIDPEAQEYAEVRGLLLDPSCSGSGTTLSRMDYLLPSAADRPSGEAALTYCDDRVEALAQFQEAALKHALRFPALQRLVYSTCSLHIRENEGVVAAVLDQATAAGFELADPFPSWPRRGVAGTVQGAEKLIRTDPEHDGTDGFFVAVFEKPSCGTMVGADPPGECAVAAEHLQLAIEHPKAKKKTPKKSSKGKEPPGNCS